LRRVGATWSSISEREWSTKTRSASRSPGCAHRAHGEELRRDGLAYREEHVVMVLSDHPFQVPADDVVLEQVVLPEDPHRRIGVRVEHPERAALLAVEVLGDEPDRGVVGQNLRQHLERLRGAGELQKGRLVVLEVGPEPETALIRASALRVPIEDVVEQSLPTGVPDRMEAIGFQTSRSRSRRERCANVRHWGNVTAEHDTLPTVYGAEAPWRLMGVAEEELARPCP
jgi:hypothetical protein